MLRFNLWRRSFARSMTGLLTDISLTHMDEENTAMRRRELTAKDEEIRSLQEKYQQSKSEAGYGDKPHRTL